MVNLRNDMIEEVCTYSYIKSYCKIFSCCSQVYQSLLLQFKCYKSESSLPRRLIFIRKSLFTTFKLSIRNSRFMHSSHNFQNSLMFRIENNVLIGEEVPIRKDCTNVGALVLEKMRSRPEFVAQVSRHRSISARRGR